MVRLRPVGQAGNAATWEEDRDDPLTGTLLGLDESGVFLLIQYPLQINASVMDSHLQETFGLMSLQSERNALQPP
jgi:hypothetical protein